MVNIYNSVMYNIDLFTFFNKVKKFPQFLQTDVCSVQIFLNAVVGCSKWYVCIIHYIDQVCLV